MARKVCAPLAERSANLVLWPTLVLRSCFALLLTEREEHAGEWERGRSRGGQGGEEGEGEAGDDAAEEGFSGRLGRAFAAGEGLGLGQWRGL